MKPKNILIIGGGIAGIALANFLSKDNNIVIIEKSSRWRTIGIGVGIWRNGLSILEKLDLGKKFWESGQIVSQGATMSIQGELLFQMKFGSLSNPIAITFEREILHTSLNQRLINIPVRFDTTICSLSQLGSGVEVEFNTGSKEVYDLVVGADGIRSTVRSLVFGKDPLRSYGWNIWGTWVPASTAHFPGYYILGGANESLISFPYHDRQAIGMMYKASDNEWPNKDWEASDVLSKFPRLKKVAEKMIYSSDLSSVFCDKLQYVEMSQWNQGRVVLIGDARHGMSPLTGLGTSLALEDSYVLAQELNSSDDIDLAIRKFSQRRNMRLQSIKTFKNIIENIGLTQFPIAQSVRDIALRHMPTSLPNHLFRNIFSMKI